MIVLAGPVAGLPSNVEACPGEPCDLTVLSWKNI
jgi:hypothetical protein